MNESQTNAESLILWENCSPNRECEPRTTNHEPPQMANPRRTPLLAIVRSSIRAGPACPWLGPIADAPLPTTLPRCLSQSISDLTTFCMHPTLFENNVAPRFIWAKVGYKLNTTHCTY
ncbi:hypothetical protein GALMADRAFT_245036 [Galerina marginata CBS 339.88]|uniref:Uncharacterized protein n=1 Tax=Galerina marginata (strain CBS 339.88) TaxID=685588 RepID=A0A067TGG0_GALM3|nr:hypothetical protein GALMADRAFT_245036 [Galerina marginata CBS 339.88]